MPDNLREQLQHSLGASYSLERELGGGGMSRVFVAMEKALARRVVIKVLSPELAAGVSAKRFAREIRLAASLQQANIVPVLAAGVSNELPYYVMPFVEGLSLRGRLERERPLSISAAISVLRDVSRALAYAHEHGVVHRDIKPENVLLSGDAAVVTDFGIARALSVARLADTNAGMALSTVTHTGTALGTPGYMAPEQVAADPGIDERTDLYSFGCLAYELLAGSTPFAGRPTHQILTAHLTERPVPLGRKREDCPAEVERLVMQCLEKDPALRPRSAREILLRLDSATSPSGVSAIQRLRSRRVATIGLSVAAALLAGAGIVSARAWFGPAAHTLDIAALAVLPFEHAGGDSAQEYLAEGLSDDLTTALGRAGRIRIVSRMLSYRYRGQRAVDAREVGRALGSDHVVHGTVRQVGRRLRVSAQLLRARDNSELWASTYEREASDALTIPDAIAQDIVVALYGGAPESHLSRTQLTSSGTSHPEAYDLYLRGRFLLQRRGPRVQQAVEKFAQAITKDSSFARAYAGLSVALELLPYFSEVSVHEVRGRAVAAAQRALALDSSLAEAHTALALAYGHAYEWERAAEEHRRALAADESDAGAHVQYGRYLHYTGRLVEARAEFARARALDPYSALASGWLSHELLIAGRTAEALAEAERAMELDSTIAPVRTFAMEAYLAAGRHVEARRLLRGFPLGSPTWATVIAHGYIGLGERDEAQRIVRELESRRPLPAKSISAIGFIRLALGDTAAALQALERATDAKEPWPTDFSLSEPLFDVLRGDPRFAAVVRRVGLPVQRFTVPKGGRPG